MYSRIKHWSLRLLGVGALIAAGYVAFRTAKTWPRCVITSETHILHFPDDGRTIVTGYTGTRIGPVQRMGEYKLPLQGWDTHEGVIVKNVMENHSVVKDSAIHRCGRVARHPGHKLVPRRRRAPPGTVRPRRRILTSSRGWRLSCDHPLFRLWNTMPRLRGKTATEDTLFSEKWKETVSPDARRHRAMPWQIPSSGGPSEVQSPGRPRLPPSSSL
jgi:hypothetical protein